MHNSFEGLGFMGVRPNLETPLLPRLQFCDIVLQHPPAPTVSSLLEPPSWRERRRRGNSSAEHFDIVDTLPSVLRLSTLTVWTILERAREADWWNVKLSFSPQMLPLNNSGRLGKMSVRSLQLSGKGTGIIWHVTPQPCLIRGAPN